MAACQHRPEDGCLLKPCAAAFLDHRCVCATEVQAEQVENRVARVPDSARTQEAS